MPVSWKLPSANRGQAYHIPPVSFFHSLPSKDLHLLLKITHYYLNLDLSLKSCASDPRPTNLFLQLMCFFADFVNCFANSKPKNQTPIYLCIYLSNSLSFSLSLVRSPIYTVAASTWDAQSLQTTVMKRANKWLWRWTLIFAWKMPGWVV